MKQVILFHKQTRKRLVFSSLKEASEKLDVKYQKLRYDLLTYGEHGDYVIGEKPVESEPDEQEYDSPRIELDVPHYANINGEAFVAVKCSDKTNCTKCDIFKLDPPLSILQSPLCYKYNCGRKKIVDICARYKCIWKRKKK